MKFFPRDLGGTDSGDGNNNKEIENYEYVESDEYKLELEYENFDCLTDSINMVVGDGRAVADT